MKEEKQASNKRSKEEQQLHIHIERWQDIVDLLDDGKKIFMLSAVVVIIGVALIIGVTFIILQLKKSFTYSDVTTNALGVTTIRDEQKEVSYFLFNTATLWASSGIEVKAGDVISIHASGSAHTAIHHLYDAAGKNYRPEEDYFDANGERFNHISERDRARRKYRIVPYLPNNALIMQVYNSNGRPPLKATTEEQKKNFYYISQHRENIIINEGGTLYFAINDIVLDSTTIFQMKEDNYQYMLDPKKNEGDTTLVNNHDLILDIYNKDINRQSWRDSLKGGLLKANSTKTKQSFILPADLALSKEVAKLSDDSAKTFRRCLKQAIYQFGPYYDQDSGRIDTLTFKTEMDYYLEHKYTRAWFDDNLGSFLIIVEKNYRK